MKDKIRTGQLNGFPSRGEGPPAEPAPELDFAAEVRRAAEEDVGAVPFERSYWVLPGKLLAGAYPGDPCEGRIEEKLRLFLDGGIRCFVDLTSPEDEKLYGQAMVPYRNVIEKMEAGDFRIHYRRMPILDMDVPAPARMKDILDIIDAAVLGGAPVYVHCLGGFGRTGTVVGCWIVRHGIGRGGAVIDLIRKLRRGNPQADRKSPQTAAQRRFILAWKPGQ
ncbi:MAG: dual specificity protein phosphatase family protein [Acidobacteria bacterium]|nr:dual specificity protein phosphatase family protein [Acidobacteriota bacterium]